jgi:penicillin amidase
MTARHDKHIDRIEALQAALPDVAGTLYVDGLDGEIDIYRDRYGIPHVKATSTRDAFFGQGLATAQDRLWHMDADRHRAYGRWAEWMGPSGVAQDVTMRQFHIGRTAKTDYDAVNADTRAMLDAYAEGVNAFMHTTPALPLEYRLIEARPEPWQPWDAIAIFKVRHILMGIFEGKLWRARLVNHLGAETAAGLFTGYEPGQLVIVPPGETYDGPLLHALELFQKGLEAIAWLHETPESGSNNWAVSGHRTASGKPLLAGDPHRGLDIPNVYYQNHIACPEFDVIGMSFPGVPGFPHFGHNAHVAWCITHAQADYQDLYVERFNSDDPVQYAFKGEWKQAEVHRETIAVKGGESVEIEVAVTHHGPIIGGDPRRGMALAFKYTATAEPNCSFESIRQMLSADNAVALDEAMRSWVDPCNNFVYADVQGNIGYLQRGRVPIRTMANAWLPVPGWTGEHEWQGHIPFEAAARSLNPDTGLIVTANNRIVGQDYPYYLSLDNAPDYRARRILDRLQDLTQATVEDMRAIHAERVSIPARSYMPWIAEIDPPDTLCATAKALLCAWDCSMDADAVAPTIYSALRGRLMRLIIHHLLGDTLADDMFRATGRGAPVHMRHLAVRMNTAAAANDTSLLPPGQTWTSIIALALSEALTELKSAFGDDIRTWVWGDVHQTKPTHMLSSTFSAWSELLDPPAVPLGGDFDTPLAGSYTPGGPYTISGTSLARYVFDTADWDNSRWIVPLGASGHPGSVHYADQTPIWAKVDLIPMTYTWDAIKVGAESHQRLKSR